MKFFILGTGSATPIRERKPSAFVLDLGNENLLLDCGEGTQYQMLKHRVRISRLNYILISHLHGDHYFGLIGLLNSINHSGRKEPLVLIGPKGLEEIISVQLRYGNSFLNYEIDFKCTNPKKAEEVFSNEKIIISSFPLKHRIDCTGFLISEHPHKRKILTDKLPKDFPIPYFKMLQDGLNIKDELSGEVLLNQDYTSDPLEPKKIAYCTDTIYDPELVQYIKNVDLLYHEATFTDELIGRAKETFHSTARNAAQIAKDAEVKQLVVGHFSSRYKTLDNFKTEATSIFKNSIIAEEGLSIDI